jgi:7-cyano-7-deazaguanine synthase
MKTSLLLSGGMDSVAIVWWKGPDIAITIDYGQVPAEAEIRAACAVASTLGIEHHIIHCDLASLGSGDMAGSAPLHRSLSGGHSGTRCS